jgi:hypothetical protein
MGRGNTYFRDSEISALLAAVDAMLDGLPTGDNVPEVDRADATRDRAEYELLRVKLERLQATGL